jgi:hypothetical protein
MERRDGCSNPSGATAGDDPLVVEIISHQLQHFTGAETGCRGLQLPEGLMLHYAPCRSLYFFLRTWVEGGKIKSCIHATDNPYDRHKAVIGEVSTPLFDANADARHLDRIERLLNAWVDFVRDDADLDGPAFRSFTMRATA